MKQVTWPLLTYKEITDILEGAYSSASERGRKVAEPQKAYDQEIENMSPKQLAKHLKQLEDKMINHEKNLEFEEAASLRDDIKRLKESAFQ